MRGSASAWTVQDGDTLRDVAAAAWGDASLWYLIAEANGLTSASILTAGQRLTIPAKAGNVHNNADTFRPYDPNQALGNLNPTQPKPPKQGNKGCGVVGQIIAVVIAAAIVVVTKGAGQAQAFAVLKAAGLAKGAAAVGSAIVSAAASATAASVGSQAFLVATGAQDDIDWKQVGISALSAGIARGIGGSPIGKAIGKLPVSGVAKQVILRTGTNVLTQGVAVATGLQHKFDWTGVAAAGVIALTDATVGADLAHALGGGRFGQIAKGTLSAVAGASTRSVVDGTSFGDNLIAVLPDVIGATIGGIFEDYWEANAQGGGASTADRVGAASGPSYEFGGGVPDLRIRGLSWLWQKGVNAWNNLTGGGSPVARHGAVTTGPASAGQDWGDPSELPEVIVDGPSEARLVTDFYTRTARGETLPYGPLREQAPRYDVEGSLRAAQRANSSLQSNPALFTSRLAAGQNVWTGQRVSLPATTPQPGSNRYHFLSAQELTNNRYDHGYAMLGESAQSFRNASDPYNDPLSRLVSAGAGTYQFFTGKTEQLLAPVQGMVDYSMQGPSSLTNGVVPATVLGDTWMFAATLGTGRPPTVTTLRTHPIAVSNIDDAARAPMHPLTDISARETIDMAISKGLQTPPDSLILWSGLGRDGAARSQAFAREFGGVTLEMTPGGKWLDSMDIYGPASPFTRVEADTIFGEVSGAMVGQASGQVRSVLGQVRPDRIYWQYELPALQQNPAISGLDPLQLRPKFKASGY